MISCSELYYIASNDRFFFSFREFQALLEEMVRFIIKLSTFKPCLSNNGAKVVITHDDLSRN